jgi:alpha-beta hydrolase superfamily lysophospholipase
MGGLVSVLAAHRDQGQLFKTTVLEAPLIKLHEKSGHPVQIFLAKLISFLPKLQIPATRLDRNLLTRSEELKSKWDKDPLMVLLLPFFLLMLLFLYLFFCRNRLTPLWEPPTR